MQNETFLMSGIHEVHFGIVKFIISRYKTLGIAITPVQGRILMFLYDKKEAICQKDIERFIACNKSTLSSILNTMEKNDLIVRVGSEDDSRCKNILLTDKALSIVFLLKQEQEHIEKVLSSCIDEEEYLVFCRVVKKIKENLEGIKNDQNI